MGRSPYEARRRKEPRKEKGRLGRGGRGTTRHVQLIIMCMEAPSFTPCTSRITRLQTGARTSDAMSSGTSSVRPTSRDTYTRAQDINRPTNRSTSTQQPRTNSARWLFAHEQTRQPTRQGGNLALDKYMHDTRNCLQQYLTVGVPAWPPLPCERFLGLERGADQLALVARQR